MERLTGENRQLKMKIEEQSKLLNNLRMHVPAHASHAGEDLLRNNSQLYSDLEEKEAQLEIVVANDSEDDLLNHIESLN